MTRGELRQFYQLRHEIDDYEERILRLRASATAAVGSLNAVPSGGVMSDKVGDYASEIGDLEASLKFIRWRLMREKQRLADWIISVDDPIIRRALMFKYFDGLTWQATATRIGGGNTADGLRKRCIRFLSM